MKKNKENIINFLDNIQGKFRKLSICLTILNAVITAIIVIYILLNK